jgi:DNA-binding transcriptional LysR family regulator
MRDLNDLQFFVAVVEQGSFSEAARHLGIPKSRVSRRVALLEEQLGVRLIERSTRSLNVTEVGQQIFEHARAAIEEASAVEEVALRTRSEPRGLVRVSCPLGLHGFISRGLAKFLAENPMLCMQIIVTNRRVDLIEEAIDIAIRIREKLDTDQALQVKQIGGSKRILVAAPKLFEGQKPPSTPAELTRFPILHQQEQQRSTDWTLTNGSGDKQTVHFTPKLATGDFGILLDAARDGGGVALLPWANCGPELGSGELIRILPQWGVADGILHLVFTSRRGMRPAVRAVVDFAANALRAATN